MQIHAIPYQQTGYFSKLIIDYLNKERKLDVFYQNFPNKRGFEKQIEQRQSFPFKNRELLVNVFKEQYQSLSVSSQVNKNIQLLKDTTTFTVTTGHQLNLFTGPLYFLYKIITTINLSKQLKQYFPQYSFVPVYWMATEDHDFDEINHFYYKGQKNEWKKEAKGAVGQLKTDEIQQVLDIFAKQTGTSKNAKKLQDLFEKSYCNHPNLASATRYLVNQLFEKEGLLIIDADSKTLKKQFSKTVKDELLHQNTYKCISATSLELEKKYKIQVNPRKINLFYLKKGMRERIFLEKEKYRVNNTSISFTKDEILAELSLHPERFSPNVIMRPLYQETILPNLCYIGGSGELAYWFQLKANFEQQQIPFPILLLRNSVLIASKQQMMKKEKLSVSTKELFLKQSVLQEKKVRELSKINIDFSIQKKHLQQQFKELKKIAEQTDKSFIGAVNAQEKKQLNGLNYLEKRLLKAQKRHLKDVVSRIEALQNQLFPNKNLQERYSNFSDFYVEMGEQLITILLQNLSPLQQEFLVIEI